MSAHTDRQRAGRVIIVLLIALVASAGLAAGYFFYWRNREVQDPRRMQELQDAPLRQSRTQAADGEWPQWRGPNRDGISTETGLLTTWPADGPKKLWEARSADSGKPWLGYSSFAVVGGKVYTLVQEGDQETVLCWEADTGQEVWRFGYFCRFENSFGSGPRSTPTVHDGLIYTVGATGHFHCLKADTGEKVWSHDLLDEFGAANLEWGVSFSPLIEGDLVYTNPGGSRGSSIVAFDRKTGELAWKALDDRAGYSSPIAATLAGVRQLLFFTARGLVGVSPTDGQEYWRYDWKTAHDVSAATPIVVDDYVFISSGYKKGAAVVKVEADGPRLKANRVYETRKMCNHFSSCVLYQEHLYGFSDPGYLVCMNFRTGDVQWRQDGFQKGSLLVADGHLIVLGENGILALVEAHPEEYREKARFQPFRGKCWAVPVLAGGKLYLRDESTVMCLQLKE